MEKLLNLIVKSIVQKPEAVKISTNEDESLTTLFLQADPEDLKIIIGKQGRTIKAIRNLLRLAALKQQLRVNLEIKEA